MNCTQNFAIVVAGGKGLRMGSKIKKQYLHLDGVPVLTRTIMAFEKCESVHEIVLVIPKTDIDICKKNIIEPYGFKKNIRLIEGGEQRQNSVLNGLKYVCERKNPEKEIIVLIHDGVRPFIDQNLIKGSIKNAIKFGACIPGVKICDTIKKINPDLTVDKTIERDCLYSVQTPQVFKLGLILNAFDHAVKTSFTGTDDASLVEYSGQKVHVIEGSKLNIKITTPEDLILGKSLIDKKQFKI
jgi:2-C-methyl-D-erythritol 4-phosphate cytidylyltransferase